MKRVIRFFCLALILLCKPAIAAVQVEAETFLWKIEKQGLPVSYLLGTIHYGYKNTVLSPQRLQILHQAEALMVESDFQMSRPDQLKLANQMISSDKKGLSVFNERQQAQLKNCLSEEEKPLMPFLRPWVFFMKCSYQIPEGVELETGVDRMLLAAYQGQVIPLQSPLEVAEYFISIPDEYVISMLKEMLAQRKQNKALPKWILNAYYRNQLQKITDLILNQKEVMKKGSNEEQAFWQNWFFNRILVERNQIWLPKIEKELADKRTLIAVGAAHLTGDQGLIHLLRRQGYEVSPVFEK